MQRLGDIHRLCDGVAGNLQQHIARAYPRVVALATGRHVQRQNLVLAAASSAVDPCNTIIWKMIHGLLPEIHKRAAHRCYRQNEQQRADELGLKIPQATVSADTPLAHTYTSSNLVHA